METIMNYKGANANKSGMFRVNVPVVNEVDGELVNNNVKEVNLYLDGDVSIRENELIKDKLLSYDIKCNIMKFNGKDTNDIGYKNVIETQEIVNFSFEGRMKELLNL